MTNQERIAQIIGALVAFDFCWAGLIATNSLETQYGAFNTLALATGAFAAGMAIMGGAALMRAIR